MIVLLLVNRYRVEPTASDWLAVAVELAVETVIAIVLVAAVVYG